MGMTREEFISLTSFDVEKNTKLLKEEKKYVLARTEEAIRNGAATFYLDHCFYAGDTSRDRIYPERIVEILEAEYPYLSIGFDTKFKIDDKSNLIMDAESGCPEVLGYYIDLRLKE